MGFSSANVILQQRHDIVMVTTGCDAIDKILDGACHTRRV